MQKRWPSENLGLGLKQLDQLGHRGRALADDASRLPLRGKVKPPHRDLRRWKHGWFYVERFFLCRHYSLERRISSGVKPLVDGEDSRQWKFDDLLRSFELPLGRSLSALDFQRRDRGYAGKSEQFGRHGTDHAIR